MTRVTLHTMATLAMVACGGPDLEAPGAANDACGDSAPVIDVLTIEPGDLLQGASGTDYSSVSITANASDPDYDLHWYAMRVWYDEDEEVSSSMTGEYLEIWGDAGDGVCNTQAAVLRMQIGVTGDPPADTPFFWTVVVYDDQENPSEPVTQAFTTPSDPT